LAASGDSPAAHHSYREYRTRLREEMNVEPDAETAALYQQIREKDKTPKSRSTITITSTSHPNTHTPTHAFTPSPPHPLTPSTLPHPITALIGREQDVREVVSTVAKSRLVTLVGGGGVGKTRLAIQAAQEVSSQFAEGAVFVALASLADPRAGAGIC